ncbi:MAG: hypothetical protein K8R23_00855 [Chthoniobacter sp.]|nr:hypothetical protein [Chthoniobacter sp.]
MRTAIARLTAPLTAWIPDISAVPMRRQVGIGVVASVVLHLLAFLVIAVFAAVLPKTVNLTAAAPPPAQELELQIMPPEEPKIAAAPVAEEKAFIDSRGLAESKPATDPLFESDKDMTEASAQPATGELPLPSTEGTGRMANVFETKKSAVGAITEPPAPTPPPPAQAQPEPAAPPPETPPAPPATPAPKNKDKPDPADVAKATLERLREVEKKRDEEIALAAKPLPPLPTPPPRAPRQEMAKLTTPAPELRPPAKPGYQPEQEQSRVEGRITNRGKNAVSAVATPLGKYKAQVYNAIGSRWLYYVKNQMDVLAIGSARVSFAVTNAGRVRDIRVEGNTANASFAEVCERAIRDAEISQPPAGSLDQMRDGRLEYTITFTLYNFRE